MCPRAILTQAISELTLIQNAEKAAAATGQQTTRTIASLQRLSSIELDDRLIAWDELRLSLGCTVP